MSDMRTWINMTNGNINTELPPVGPDAEISEAPKPDFLDLDKDGNKKEPMKKAAKDKEEKAKNEAVGDFAEPIYKLIDDLGDSSIVLDNLIMYLDSDTISNFVDDFRREHDMKEESIEEAPVDEDSPVTESAYLDNVKKLLG